MKTLFKIAAALAVAGLATLFIASTSRCLVEDNIQKQFPVKAGDRLLVALGCGDIEITTADTDRVSVTVQRRVTHRTEKAARQLLERHAVTFERTGDTFAIRAEAGSDPGRQPDAIPASRFRYRITVPRTMPLDLETERGSIRADQLRAGVFAQARGDMLISFASAPQGDCLVASRGGNITLAVPEKASLNVDLRSSGAPIESDVEVVRQGEQYRGLIGTVGEGGQRLKAISAGGNIRLIKNPAIE